VPSAAYFDQAVRWLRANDITHGAGRPGHYSPDTNVTRAQMAAFLWRAAGSPTGHPDHGFRDIPRGSYYDHAVRWLRANDITHGAGRPGHYSPDTNVTRAQMAAFLWRAAGSPTGHPDHGFRDIPRGSYYDHAVRWLRANDITHGAGRPGHYSPDTNVTRAQMAAFLWRAAGSPGRR
jgi:hypothetical protein